jgi:hypothetical protein
MTVPQRDRSRIERLPQSADGESRYLHPGGYVIESQRRTWSERGRPTGRSGHDPAPPLTWWAIYRAAGDPDTHGTRYRRGAHFGGEAQTCDTLREAREWCDRHPLWTVAVDEKGRTDA